MPGTHKACPYEPNSVTNVGATLVVALLAMRPRQLLLLLGRPSDESFELSKGLLVLPLVEGRPWTPRLAQDHGQHACADAVVPAPKLVEWPLATEVCVHIPGQALDLDAVPHRAPGA